VRCVRGAKVEGGKNNPSSPPKRDSQGGSKEGADSSEKESGSSMGHLKEIFSGDGEKESHTYVEVRLRNVCAQAEINWMAKRRSEGANGEKGGKLFHGKTSASKLTQLANYNFRVPHHSTRKRNIVSGSGAGGQFFQGGNKFGPRKRTRFGPQGRVK